MKDIVHAAALVLLAMSPTTLGAEALDACTVLSADEIRAALGRTQLGAARPGAASGGYSDCRFPGSGAGDVRITLGPETAGAKDDFELQSEILVAEGKSFEKLPGIGDGAYYWDDTLQFRVGNRIVSLWVNRTPRTEAPATVKGALSGLSRQVANRLRTAR